MGGDRDRALREWQRYEGTAQRDLFRQLRERFLARHAAEQGWTLDVGSGPGRFTRWIGAGSCRRVALDLAREALVLGQELAVESDPALAIHPVRGDAARPPFLASSFGEVAILGNTLGFETRTGPRLLEEAHRLLAPLGRLLVEIAPGNGERSNYLARLPPGAVRRLLAAPVAAVAPRVAREGFAPEPTEQTLGSFRRWSVPELLAAWARLGWPVREVLAVAPSLGSSPERITEVARNPNAWSRLLEVEEAIGKDPARWTHASAVLLAVERPSSPTKTIGQSPPSISP